MKRPRPVEHIVGKLAEIHRLQGVAAGGNVGLVDAASGAISTRRLHGNVL